MTSVSPILPANSNSDKLILSLKVEADRRALARADMLIRPPLGQLRYLFVDCPAVRKVNYQGKTLYSMVDIVTALADTDAIRHWSDIKKAVKRDDPLTYDLIVSMNLPRWADGKQYKTDTADAGTLYGILRHMNRTPLVNAILREGDRLMGHILEGDPVRVIEELQLQSGWAASLNHEAMRGLSIVPDSELQWWQK